MKDDHGNDDDTTLPAPWRRYPLPSTLCPPPSALCPLPATPQPAVNQVFDLQARSVFEAAFSDAGFHVVSEGGQANSALEQSCGLLVASRHPIGWAHFVRYVRRFSTAKQKGRCAAIM